MTTTFCEQYKLTKIPAVIRISDGAWIPTCPTNADYRAYLDWLAQDNTPLPEDTPTPEELAAEVETTRLAKDAATAKAHAKLRALSQMSPAQVQTWAAANVTNLAQAQDAIATLAVAVSVLIRRI